MRAGRALAAAAAFAAVAGYVAWAGRPFWPALAVALLCAGAQAASRPRWTVPAAAAAGFLLGLVLRAALQEPAVCGPAGCVARAAGPSPLGDLLPLLLGLAAGELAGRDFPRRGERPARTAAAWAGMAALAAAAALAAVALAGRADADAAWLPALAVPIAAVLALRPWPALLGSLLGLAAVGLPGAADLLWGRLECDGWREGPGAGLALLPAFLVGLPVAFLLAAVRTWTRLAQAERPPLPPLGQ